MHRSETTEGSSARPHSNHVHIIHNQHQTRPFSFASSALTFNMHHLYCIYLSFFLYCALIYSTYIIRSSLSYGLSTNPTILVGFSSYPAKK